MKLHSLLSSRTLSAVFLALSVIALPRAGLAEEFCDNWASYIWEFEGVNDASADRTWTELNSMSLRLSQGRHSAVGTARRATIRPFPSIPSAVESGLERVVQTRVRGYYDKHVLLGRRIEDEWNDKFSHQESATSMQRFVAERDRIVAEMNALATAARSELIRFGLRSRDCFTEYDALARKKVRTLTEALNSANSALKPDESIWGHALEATDDGRKPSSN